MLIDYYKKYCPIGDEYRDQSPFTKGLSSARAVRYYGAGYLISSVEKTLEAQQKYSELIGFFNNYVNDQNEKIRNRANTTMTYLSRKTTKMNQPIQKKESMLTILTQAKTATLISIISTARVQFQEKDYSLAETAFDATKILTDRKVLSEVESTKLIEMFTPKIPKSQNVVLYQ